MEKINIEDIILWILFIISIAIALWVLFSDSPTFEQIILAFLLTTIFGIGIKLTKIETELRALRKSFQALATDFKDHIKRKKH